MLVSVTERTREIGIPQGHRRKERRYYLAIFAWRPWRSRELARARAGAGEWPCTARSSGLEVAGKRAAWAAITGIVVSVCWAGLWRMAGDESFEA